MIKPLLTISIILSVFCASAWRFNNVGANAVQDNISGNILAHAPFVQKNPFETVDAYARNCPDSCATDTKKLAAYLLKGAGGDIEKARAIFIWLTENISYDDDSFNNKIDGANSAKGVLASRKAVCAGYSALYNELGKLMGLQIKIVVGYAKGYGYEPGDRVSEFSHAWNIIKLGEEWRIFDATWGAMAGSNVKGEMVSKKDFDDFWFNMEPDEAIFSHFPENPQYAFTSQPVDQNTFSHLPQISENYFRLGFNGKQTLQTALQNKGLQFPECEKPDTYIFARKAPAYRKLKRNQSYSFAFFAPQAIEISAIDGNKKFYDFKNEKGLFTLDFTPNIRGEVSIVVRYTEEDESFYPLMIYQAE